jgi:hypothetical protein
VSQEYVVRPHDWTFVSGHHGATILLCLRCGYTRTTQGRFVLPSVYEKVSVQTDPGPLYLSCDEYQVYEVHRS